MLFTPFELFVIILSLALSILIVKITIVVAHKRNWYDEIDARKVHKGEIPRLGGFGLFASFAISFFTYEIYTGSIDVSVIPYFVGGMCIWFSGIIDDFRNLRARSKFIIQIFVIALSVIFSPYYLKDVFSFTLPPFLGKFLTFCWIILLVNAFNLIDGIDWLCSGISLFSFLTLALCVVKTNHSLCFFLCVLCASIIGFMCFNKPDAKIFLGDGGSQSLGYCIAVIPLFCDDLYFEYNKILIMPLLASIPVTDVIAAILRRRREHRSIFSTDRAHIHHKFINIGFSKVFALFYLLLLQFIVCMAIYLTQYMGTKHSTVLLFFTLLFVELFFILIHYINRSVNLKMKGCLSESPQEEH